MTREELNRLTDKEMDRMWTSLFPQRSNVETLRIVLLTMLVLGFTSVWFWFVITQLIPKTQP